MSPTGKSFRVVLCVRADVLACARSGCPVELAPKVVGPIFPFPFGGAELLLLPFGGRFCVSLYCVSFVRLFVLVCLIVCLLVFCLFACLLTCFVFDCLFVCLSVRLFVCSFVYYLKALPLPPAPLTVAGFLVVGLVTWQYSDVFGGYLLFGFVLLVLSVAMCVLAR